MKKKVLPVIMAVCFIAAFMVGCGKEEETVVEESNVVLDTIDVATQVCSLCEEAKMCGTYQIGETSYIVCDDCFGEFAYAFDYKSVCSGCQFEKVCSCYTVEEAVYLVCDDCFPTFAYEKQIPQMCNVCQQMVNCATYDLKGNPYVICDECYPSWAEANGLITEE